MPPDIVLKIAGSAHRLILSASGRRVGWSMSGMPVVELTTTGRKTGQPRATLLTVPWQDGARMAVIAAAAGSQHDPDWYRNLRANPSVDVRTKDGIVKMTARNATGAERSKIWAAATASHPQYSDYQTKTDREIPVVILDPA